MSNEGIKIYEFGPFHLDADERRLLRNGEPVHLTAKIFDILLLMVRNRGKLVEKDELMRLVWPNQFVEENNLTVSMSALRRALGEISGSREYIETIPGRGYRFVARITEYTYFEAAHGEVRAELKQANNLAESIRSLAVLPLGNDSNDPQLEYLSDGITESIINSLSQLPGLKVLARNTVFRYRGQEADAQEVGRLLSVRAVLIGRLLPFGGQLVIRVELVDVVDGTQVWGEQYSRPISDIFAIQEEIARDISASLRLKLSGRDHRRLTKRETQNAEAYQLYLKGRYFWNKFNKKWVNKSIDYFQQAIEIDPNYALAYAGLAESYLRLSALSSCPKELLPRGREAAIKAVALDDTLAEPHAVLGLVKLWHDHDWLGGKIEYEKAISVNPASSIAHQHYGAYFMFLGRFEEAIAEHNLALELDPFSLQLYVDSGANLYMMGSYDQAIDRFHKALEIAPDYFPARYALAWGYIQKRCFQEAIADLQKIQYVGEDSYLSLGLLGYAYGLSGDAAGTRRVLEELNTLAQSNYVSPYSMVLVNLGLGDRAAALDWLDELYEDRGYWLCWLKVVPELDVLRSEPRFKSLLRTVGLLE